MDFTLRFSFDTEPQSNTYKTIEYVKTVEWWNWGTYHDFAFKSEDLARAYNLEERSGRLYLPDAGLNVEQRPLGYSGPRIDYIRSRLTNLDNGQENRINPFMHAYNSSAASHHSGRGESRLYEGNRVEFGRSVFR